MLFSLNKIRELIGYQYNLTNQQMIDAINKIGFEVDDIIKPILYKNLKIGKILTITKNPDADRLNVCEVEFDDKIRTIQTNDQSVQVDHHYLAIVDEGYAGNLIIKPTKIKNVLSEGMFCSLEELGFNKNLIGKYQNKIFEISSKYELSTDVVKLLQLDDWYVEIDILSNRNDANSYVVMASEIAAYYNFDLNLLEVHHSFSDLFVNIDSQKNLDIKVTTSLPSPLESFVIFDFKEYQELNINDQLLLVRHQFELKSTKQNIANLLALVFGVPVININKNQHFSVENSSLLDNNETINVISKNNNIIAGITNLSPLEDDSTLAIIFPNLTEARKNLKNCKISNHNAGLSIKKVSQGLIKVLLSHNINNLNNVNVISALNEPKLTIELDKQKINRYANFDFFNSKEFKDIKEQLRTLDFNFWSNNQSSYLTTPINRYDISNMEDVIEEVFRFYNYDNFSKIKITKPVVHVNAIDNTKLKLSTLGYHEVCTYTLRSFEGLAFNPFKFKQNLSLSTYTSEKHRYVRNSQLDSLLEVIQYNYKRKITNLNLFEIGMINENKKSLIFSSNTKTFNQVKEDIQSIVGDYEIRKWSDRIFLHTYISAKIYKNKKHIGWIAKLNPKYDSSNSIIVELLNFEFYYHNKFNPYDKKPFASADFTFELKPKKSISEHVNNILSISPNVKISIIDRYNVDSSEKITIRVLGNQQEVAKINKQFN